MTVRPSFGAPDEQYLAKARQRMKRIDNMPRGLRECVHEFGLTIVDACTQVGVVNPRHIRHLVETIRNEGKYGNPGTGQRNCPACSGTGSIPRDGEP